MFAASCPAQPPGLAGAKSIFSYYDTDGDGKLMLDEFKVALQAAGACPSDKEFDEVCKSTGGAPDLAAFVQVLEVQLEKRPTSEQLMDQFRGVTQEGKIDAEILKYIATQYGEKLSQSEVKELMHVAAPDEDGAVDVKHLTDTLLPPLLQPPVRS
eukprot:gnl/TRDRNA2_/TRDRNA2_185260_c0_seq1.p1 gnl/TRDRNA2_/TRDRNA2_185260_c0~~gnl/TRDRNA2_/TRDRNA2_185260_c0_seq1.p1  ORF type:complete len:155 (-),score=48.12 gnl/TRDRNA2_/TRDRNA2_185260_c0_seq1:120-584(-)